MTSVNSEESDDDQYDESDDDAMFTPRDPSTNLIDLLVKEVPQIVEPLSEEASSAETPKKAQFLSLSQNFVLKTPTTQQNTGASVTNVQSSPTLSKPVIPAISSLDDDSDSILTKKQKRSSRSRRKASESGGSSSGDAFLILRLDPIREGFLRFKGRRRWVILDSQNLYVFKSPEDFGEPMEKISLQYSAVRKQEKDITIASFEIVTAGGTHVFSVDKEKLVKPPVVVEDWISKIRSVCDSLVMNTIGGGPDQHNILSKSYSKLLAKDDVIAAREMTEGSMEAMEIAILEGNRTCADCGYPSPDWASINLGVFICIKCSGIHRSFGTHISKVRSVKLDKWEPSWVEKMRSVGNIESNKIWLHHVPVEFTKITEDSDLEERKRWLNLKYVVGRFRVDYDPEKDKKIKTTPEPPASSSQPTLDIKEFSREFKTHFKELLLSSLQEDEEFLRQVRELLFPRTPVITIDSTTSEDEKSSEPKSDL